MRTESSYNLEWKKIGKKCFLYQIEIKTKMLLVHGELVSTSKWLTTDNWYEINNTLRKHTDQYFKDNRHMNKINNIDELCKEIVNENILIKLKFTKMNQYLKRYFKIRDKFYEECMHVEISDSSIIVKEVNIVNRKSTKKYTDNYIPECLTNNKSNKNESCNYTPSKKGKELLHLKSESYEPESMIQHVDKSINEKVVYKPSSAKHDKVNDCDADRYSPKPISNESIVLPNKVYTPTKIDNISSATPSPTEPQTPSTSSNGISTNLESQTAKKTPLRKCKSIKVDYNEEPEIPKKIRKKEKSTKEKSSNDNKKDCKRLINDLFSADESEYVESRIAKKIKNKGDGNNNDNNDTERNRKSAKAKKNLDTIKEERYIKNKYKIKKFKDSETFYANKRFCDHLTAETIMSTFNDFLPILLEEYNTYCKNASHYLMEHKRADTNISLEIYKIFESSKVLDMIQYIKKNFLNINKDVDHDEFIFNGAIPEWCLFIMMKELKLNRIDAINKLKE